MQKPWEVVPLLTRAVGETHLAEGDSFHAHNFDHVVQVAVVALMIAADDEVVGRLAAAAALCHNADRIEQVRRGVGPQGAVPEEAVRSLISTWLDHEPFAPGERETIIQAVLRHSSRNHSDDTAVQIVLMDADRIINLGAEVIFREGLYLQGTVSPVDPLLLLNDPTASWHRPGSSLRAIYEMRDWCDWHGPFGIRSPKGQELAKRRHDFLVRFIETVLAQRREIGLLDGDYPRFK